MTRSESPTPGGLRLALAGKWVLHAGYWILFPIEMARGPAALRSWESPVHPLVEQFMTGVVILAALLGIVATLGMLRFTGWSRRLFAVHVFVTVASGAIPIYGVFAPWSGTAYTLELLLSGWILAVVYFSEIRRRFARP